MSRRDRQMAELRGLISRLEARASVINREIAWAKRSLEGRERDTSVRRFERDLAGVRSDIRRAAARLRDLEKGD